MTLFYFWRVQANRIALSNLEFPAARLKCVSCKDANIDVCNIFLFALDRKCPQWRRHLVVDVSEQQWISPTHVE